MSSQYAAACQVVLLLSCPRIDCLKCMGPGVHECKVIKPATSSVITAANVCYNTHHCIAWSTGNACTSQQLYWSSKADGSHTASKGACQPCEVCASQISACCSVVPEVLLCEHLSIMHNLQFLVAHTWQPLHA